MDYCVAVDEVAGMTPVRRLGFYNTAAAAEHYLGIRWAPAVWRSVLEQAIKDVVSGPDLVELFGMPAIQAETFEADIRAAAQEWVDDDTNEPRRFVWVCEQLDLDPARVRAAIERKKVQLQGSE
jgi:hypothetical protein